jgi:preprotein translocase subunit SecG
MIGAFIGYVVPVIHVLACLFLIVVVLLQTGKGADIGAVFGGGSQTLFGSGGAGNFLTKLTTGTAIGFMVTSLILTWGGTHGPRQTLFNELNRPPEEVPAPAQQPGAPAQQGEPEAQQPTAQAQQPTVEVHQTEPATGALHFKSSAPTPEGNAAAPPPSGQPAPAAPAPPAEPAPQP